MGPGFVMSLLATDHSMKRVYLYVGLQPQLMLLDSLGASGELAGLVAFQD